jgi:hypothetical protein
VNGPSASSHRTSARWERGSPKLFVLAEQSDPTALHDIGTVDARAMCNGGKDVAAGVEPEADRDMPPTDRRAHLDDVVLDLAPFQISVRLHRVRDPRQLREVAHRVRFVCREPRACTTGKPSRLPRSNPLPSRYWSTTCIETSGATRTFALHVNATWSTESSSTAQNRRARPSCFVRISPVWWSRT